MNSSQPSYDFLDPPEKDGEIGRLGPYRVYELLGKGGMGQVFRAEDGRLKRSVALKVMNERFASTPNSKKRFVEEARSMAAIHHDNVATIFEVGVRAGTPFMAMEMLRGKTLEACLAEGTRYSADQILRIAGEVATGLSAAHAAGIVHRDVKPANIWLEEPSGRAKILDFGLALGGNGVDRFSKVGTVMGTPGYLAPEQARNEPVDDRTDLYALGVVLYQICTGRLPLTADSMTGQMIAIIAHQPTPIRELNDGIPEPLAALVEQLLAKEPRARPHSAVELAQRVESVSERCRSDSQLPLQIVTDDAPSTRSSSVTRPGEANTASAKKRWLVWGSGSLAALVVAGLVFAYAGPGRQASKLPPPVRARAKPAKEIEAAALKPLSLGPVTEQSRQLEVGIGARFIMRIRNSAASASIDPRTLYAEAREVARVATYVRDSQGVKTKARGLYPRRFSPRELPPAGEDRPLEIQLDTTPMFPGDFEIIFELQAPNGRRVSSTSTRLSLTENLGTSELLGFQTLRTHAGDGADTHVCNRSTEGLGSRNLISLHRQGSGENLLTQHIYLRFDLSKSPVPRDQIDRAVLLLTVAGDFHQGVSQISVFGVTGEQHRGWAEAGEQGLAWETAPTRNGFSGLRYLTEAKIDNGANALKDKPDGVRIYGANLDDFLRSSVEDRVTIVLERKTPADKPTCFFSKEGNPKRAPALALRPR